MCSRRRLRRVYFSAVLHIDFGRVEMFLTFGEDKTVMFWVLRQVERPSGVSSKLRGANAAALEQAVTTDLVWGCSYRTSYRDENLVSVVKLPLEDQLFALVFERTCTIWVQNLHGIADNRRT
jgi:hypothetical protein